MTQKNEITPTPRPPIAGDWEFVPELSDEFDGASLDKSKWHDHNPTWLGREPGFFSRSNVTVSDGKLHLTARAEDLPDLPPGYKTFTTAAVKSRAKALYGYFEVKCKAMNSIASSAFWFYAQEPELKNAEDKQHPDLQNFKWWTEIDVFEISAAHPRYGHDVYMTTHVMATPEDGKKYWKKGEIWKAPFNLAGDYHIYALEWNEKEIKFHIDGKVRYAMENTHWHQPLNMNFDSETMPEWFGLPDPKTLPATFSIEYVRSWKTGKR